MKLIDIPTIEETGTYYIDTDMEANPDEGIESEVEFWVSITTDWDVDRHDDMPSDHRLRSVYIDVECCDPVLSWEDKAELTRQLDEHLRNYWDKMMDYYP